MLRFLQQFNLYAGESDIMILVTVGFAFVVMVLLNVDPDYGR